VRKHELDAVVVVGQEDQSSVVRDPLQDRKRLEIPLASVRNPGPVELRDVARACSGVVVP